MDMLMLEDRVVLVTGGAMGIGRAIAEAALRERAKVVIADFNPDAGELAAAALREGGGDVLFVKADLSVEDDVRRVISETVDRFGRLDCACNNAALTRERGALHTLGEDAFDSTLRYCLTNTFLCMKHEIEVMLPHHAGSIVNISSAASFTGDPFNAPYAAAKAGVNVLTMSTAAEYATKGIRVNAVAPGVTRTPGVQHYMDSHPEVADKLSNAAPMKRLGEPEEIAEMVLFLFSERASFITGQVVSVDGGLAARGG